MTDAPVFIVSMGMVSALGTGIAETTAGLRHGRQRFCPLTLFSPGPDGPLPVAESGDLPATADPPRTHRLARLAADQAMACCDAPPDAIVIGCTTGGMPTTEIALENGIDDPAAYRHHGVGTVAEDLADRYGCNGPVLTLATACASGATAIAVAAAMIRNGRACQVLVGGADALCRLTYFGFKSLQLIDPAGARPLDSNRRGMTLGEGAAMLLLTNRPRSATDPRVLGTGLSCDAHHPSTPHPDGTGALSAMRAALADAGVPPRAIDYINLHGTGTPDNDRTEALAVNALFHGSPPPLSSTKGSTGHTLGAAGALEACFAALAIEQGHVPANEGLDTVDPDLELAPVTSATAMTVKTVLSNSFGFGGNNAALVIGEEAEKPPATERPKAAPLTVAGYACLSGKGRTTETLAAMAVHESCRGCLDDASIRRDLKPRDVRRLKRLAKMTLAMAEELRRGAAKVGPPQAVSLGTGWGAMSETSDFMARLMESGYQFPSPMDFIGSVHNAPAGQVAMLLGARGANLTTSGGDYSFEQALLAADLAADPSEPVMVMGVDEAHTALTPLFDPSSDLSAGLADGGGALLLHREPAASGIQIALATYRSQRQTDAVGATIADLGGIAALNHRYGAILAGLPAAHRSMARSQLDRFIRAGDVDAPVIDFRQLTGEFATATAIAVVAGVHWVETGTMGAIAAGQRPLPLNGKGVLVLGLGPTITAITICPS